MHLARGEQEGGVGEQSWVIIGMIRRRSRMVRMVMMVVMVVMVVIRRRRMVMMMIMVVVMVSLGALVIMPNIRWPMADPAAIRDLMDRPTPAWMSCKNKMLQFSHFGLQSFVMDKGSVPKKWSFFSDHHHHHHKQKQ